MTNILIEAVIMSFTIGGILGAVAALSLKTSKYWDSKASSGLTPVPIRSDDSLRTRRQHH